MDLILIRQNLIKGNYAPLILSIVVPIVFVTMLTMASFAHSAYYYYGGQSARSTGQTSENTSSSQDNIDGLALRVSTLQAQVAQQQTHPSGLTLSWDNIISQQAKVQTVSWTSKSVSSSQRFSHKPTIADTKHSIKMVSRHLLRKYRTRVGALPAGWPLKQGRVSSKFGWRHRRMHKGIDIAAKRGTPIFAVDEGIIERSKYVRGYGRLVEIKHSDMYSTRYAHNSRNLVKVGQKVRKGQIIALVGSTGRSTGPHVHFEIRQNGVAINPIKYLGAMDSFSLAENLKLSKYVKLSKK